MLHLILSLFRLGIDLIFDILTSISVIAALSRYEILPPSLKLSGVAFRMAYVMVQISSGRKQTKAPTKDPQLAEKANW